MRIRKHRLVIGERHFVPYEATARAKQAARGSDPEEVLWAMPGSTYRTTAFMRILAKEKNLPLNIHSWMESDSQTTEHRP